MRIGVFAGAGDASVEKKLEQFERADASGFHTAWIPGVFSHEAVILAAAAGQRTSSLEIGTFVVPTYPRHPAVMAQQALTANAFCGGRFVLGIGLSHRMVIEDSLGLDYSKPLRHMREYLSVLDPLLDGQPVAFQGEEYRVTTQMGVPGAVRPGVVVAALQPKMLRLAGERTDGTAIWMGGPRYLAEVAVPTITQAAKEAGRQPPRVIAGFPVAVTDDPATARETAHAQFQAYGDIPSYGAILEMEGAKPADLTIAGDEPEVRRSLAHLAEIGVTDFNAFPLPLPSDAGAVRRTYELLAAIAAEGI